MLRFHLTNDDLAQVQLGPKPHALWDIYFSLLLLQSREAALHFDPWRHKVRRDLARSNLTGAVTALNSLYPVDGYTPDFLTPGDGSLDVESGLDLLMATPRSRLRAELTMAVQFGQRLPEWCRYIADGDVAVMKRLGDLLGRYHAIAVAPYTECLQEVFQTEHDLRARTLREQGAEGLLAGYPSTVLSWRDGVLEMPCPVDVDLDFRPHDRPLVVLPSVFGARPTASVADGQLLTLGYPAPPSLGWHNQPNSTAPASSSHDCLAPLIGAARATALEALDRPMNTSRLASVLQLSLPTASRHAATLREAGLITSERHGQSVLHTRTPLGTALLEGGRPSASSTGDRLRPAFADGCES
ncbi:helix-turn-helix domain-containing protein [Streptomyces sp. T-3]|nr:helix-turn-helix domain-containing protein [Streptomyces sp. T-3]